LEGEIRNLENLSLRGPKWGTENAILNLYGWIYKGSIFKLKSFWGDLEGTKHDYETRITKKNDRPYKFGSLYTFQRSWLTSR
jgi:hypothetical protein